MSWPIAPDPINNNKRIVTDLGTRRKVSPSEKISKIKNSTSKEKGDSSGENKKGQERTFKQIQKDTIKTYSKSEIEPDKEKRKTIPGIKVQKTGIAKSQQIPDIVNREKGIRAYKKQQHEEMER